MDYSKTPAPNYSTCRTECSFSLFSSVTKVICVIASLGDCWIDSYVAEIWRLARNGVEKFSSTNEFVRFRTDLYSYVYTHPSNHGIKALATYEYFCDVLSGHLETINLKYADFANVWHDYCVERFAYSSDRSTLTALGKNVARTLYLGKPNVEGNWKIKDTFFPLHIHACDVCRFLATIVKKEYTGKSLVSEGHALGKIDLNPFGSLDLKGVHDFFFHRLARHEPWLGLSCPLAIEMTEPSYEAVSPSVVVDEDDAQQLAAMEDPPNAVSVIVRPTSLDLRSTDGSSVRKRIALENIQETPPQQLRTPGSFRLKQAKEADVEWT